MPIPCPYCNASIRVPVAVRKVDCPRCGEAVAVPDGTPPDILPFPATDNVPSTTRTNRSIGLTVAGVMAGFAVLSLGYALWTTDFRRSHDNKNRDTATKPATAVPPGELAGLGYLPTNVQVVAGVAVAQALETESGQAVLTTLPLVGFTPGDIDHVVAGANFDVLPLRLTVVVRTRRPLDLAKVRAELKAERGESHGGRTFYKGRLPVGTLDGYVTFPDERTLVAAMTMESLEASPAVSGGAAERFQPPIRDLIAQVPSDAPGWVVGRKDANNPVFVASLALAPIPDNLRQGLRNLTSLSLSAAERNGRLEVAARATGLDVQQAAVVAATVREPAVGRGTADGVDPLSVTWSESVADLVKRLNPPR